MKSLVKNIVRLLIFMALMLACDLVFAKTPQPADRKNLDVMKSSVVRVFVRTEDALSSGSGFAVAQDYIVTNRHVVEDALEGNEEAEVLVVTKEKEFVRGVRIFASEEHDLALIRLEKKIETTPVIFPEKKEFENLSETQEVTAMGYPGEAEALDQARALGSEGITTTTGKISRMISQSETRLIQMDAKIGHGNSGGPLFDRWGRVIGINTLKTTGENWTFSIDARELLPFLQSHGIDPQFVSLKELSEKELSDSNVPAAIRQPQRNSPKWIFDSTAYIFLIGAAGALFVIAALLLLYKLPPRRQKVPSSQVPYTPHGSGSGASAPFKGTRPYQSIPVSPRLVGVNGIHAGKSFSIQSCPFWIGRDPECDIAYLTVVEISRKHCCIDLLSSGQGYTIVDHSSNGTRMNGRLLTKGVAEALLPGAEITFRGSQESLRFEA